MAMTTVAKKTGHRFEVSIFELCYMCLSHVHESFARAFYASMQAKVQCCKIVGKRSCMFTSSTNIKQDLFFFSGMV